MEAKRSKIERFLHHDAITHHTDAFFIVVVNLESVKNFPTVSLRNQAPRLFCWTLIVPQPYIFYYYQAASLRVVKV